MTQGDGGSAIITPNLVLPRRSLLKGLAGIFCAGVAPAIIRTPNLIMPMKVVEPIQIKTWIATDKIWFVAGDPNIIGGYEITFRIADGVLGRVDRVRLAA